MAAGRGGHSARSHRGRSHEEHAEDGSERWMVTYADMVTLLLVLFIVLYAMGSVNTSKYEELKTSLAGAFSSGPTPGLTDSGSGLVSGGQLSPPLPPAPQNIAPAAPTLAPIDQAAQDAARAAAQATAQRAQPAPAGTSDAARRELEEFLRIEEEINRSLAERGLAGSAEYTINERGLAVTIVTDSLVFPGNSAVLGVDGPRILDAVIPPLQRATNLIQVDGHTNQQNVGTDPYPSGWELSSARASAVVRYLTSVGRISSGRLSAAGFSDQRPLVPASDPASVTRNRRVDIVVVSQLPLAERGALASPSGPGG
ncbi:flagellar motor protein MotB [Rhodococcus sp. X156]|uniref:OmpA/MotB family protein n=1 Tax=Rhodococcus sp. X156 TaxID=2499145 RepID=UPI000FD8693D|nr:flagellar motor protein MotB [Rhodococcus sp. X156]